MIDIKSIGVTITITAMWAAIYYILHTTIVEHPILGWVIIIGIVITHDVWSFTPQK